jgi:hypothetical protein
MTDKTLMSRVEICFRILIKFRNDLSSTQIKQLNELKFRHFLKAGMLHQYSTKMMFLVYCHIKDLENANILLDHIAKSLKPTDVDTIIEVWYNIKRLKLAGSLPFRITEIVIEELIRPESVSKLMYCLEGEDL